LIHFYKRNNGWTVEFFYFYNRKSPNIKKENPPILL
jgi:hypothetical protein